MYSKYLLCTLEEDTVSSKANLCISILEGSLELRQPPCKMYRLTCVPNETWNLFKTQGNLNLEYLREGCVRAS